MSFHEKSAWASLLAIGVVFTPYLVVVLRQPLAFGILIVAVIALVLILTGFHIVNAISSKLIRERGVTPPIDELDRMIELRAAKYAGFVLACAVLTWCLFALVFVSAWGVSAGGEPSNLAEFRVPVTQALTAVHWLFASFVLANCVYYASIVVGYRKLAHG
ncbi:hypothetical protein [Herpetosiphon geysericola]|uniref:DUF2178 domain-containing protein n=1 Tax=Herpetosiphon geysericola TaxID=70996 RepID=A0A0P6YXZ1_9CHLR|nr:hypothetical protein [Herpetosiphon geysericola]KPL90132.1 hypothetical protein SE18_07930 [Herpetosiphon geysericola]